MKYTFDYDLFSDLYNDAYGSSPRHSRFYDEATTDDDRQYLWDLAIRDLEIAVRQEEARKAEAVSSFEKSIFETMLICKCKRPDAIRHQLVALDMLNEIDPGYICYTLGLPYNEGYEEEFIPHLKSADDIEAEEALAAEGYYEYEVV